MANYRNTTKKGKSKPYVVSKSKEGFWYCHQSGYSYIPVFGSIGDKAKANRICKMMNESVGVI